MNRNITALILIILAVACYFTYTQGAWSDAMAIKKVNDQYTSAIANAQRLVKVRDQVRSDFANISVDDQNKLAKMIPTSADNIRLIVDMNSIASKNGISLKDIKASAVNDQTTTASPSSSQGISINTPKLSTVKVSFGTTASYAQFMNFLQALELNLRIMDQGTESFFRWNVVDVTV